MKGMVGVMAGMFFVMSMVVLAGCATTSEEEAKGAVTSGARAERCEGECVQPPLLRRELLPFLMREQARILARDDYKEKAPPLVTEVAYGPKPEGPHREGEPVVNAEGASYEGELQWHRNGFEAFETQGVEDRRFRKKTASGSHCYFAREPNERTPLFTIVAVHHRDRGDQLYFSGHRQRTTRIDAVPVKEAKGSPIRVGEAMDCVFRDSENLVGAVIVPIRGMNGAGEEVGEEYGVLRVGVTDVLGPTGERMKVARATGRGGEMETEEVDVLGYGPPVLEWVGLYASRYEALKAAEEVIPAGRFRLRKEYVYPRMPYQSYLGGEAEDFCPKGVRCERPRENLDANARPTLSRERIQELEASRREEEEGQDGVGSGPPVDEGLEEVEELEEE